MRFTGRVLRKGSFVAIEEIILDAQKVTTLKETLRPGLKAVFVGLNPGQKSVDCGHYYQGRHGRRFWNQLYEYQIAPSLPSGVEDDAAFERGFGFVDLVRKPTVSSKQLKLTRAEWSAAVSDLGARLSTTGDRPIVIFRYKEPWNLAGERLEQMGYCVLRMPSPYEKKERADSMMKEIRAKLATV